MNFTRSPYKAGVDDVDLRAATASGTAHQLSAISILSSRRCPKYLRSAYATMSSVSSSPNSGHPNGSTHLSTSAAPGTLYVSQPYRSSSSNKLRAMVTFAPRKSHFDISNEASTTNEFRGFFTLFWISLFLFALSTYVRSVERTGSPLNFEFATMISRDAITLALSDAALVLTTGLCVPFAKAVAKGWINYYRFGVIIQHLWQCAVLAFAITWTFNRYVSHLLITRRHCSLALCSQWPWVQSGFLTLHSFVSSLCSPPAQSPTRTLSPGHDHENALVSEHKRPTCLHPPTS